MRMNTRMARLWGNSAPAEQVAEELRQLSEARFVLKDGAWLNAVLASSRENLRAANYGDATGYEAVVNHIYVDDFVPRLNAIPQALAFAREIARTWRSQSSEERLLFIISATETSCGVRFHVVRDGVSYVDEDLETYALDALAVLDSDDDLLRGR